MSELNDEYAGGGASSPVTNSVVMDGKLTVFPLLRPPYPLTPPLDAPASPRTAGGDELMDHDADDDIDHSPSTAATPGPPEETLKDRSETKSDNGGLDVLNGEMRDMVDLVNRLRASGIEDLGLPLPRIAVVGNQSAGKSSLIEAISGV